MTVTDISLYKDSSCTQKLGDAGPDLIAERFQLMMKDFNNKCQVIGQMSRKAVCVENFKIKTNYYSDTNCETLTDNDQAIQLWNSTFPSLITG